ncbi:ABC transporter permease [Streptomyces sp. NPDC046197]|uniref:ABC transporter permease n=1 Tax=Streptomyces sp. NPDC046197 TaxID=3154337 RepID=UPI0033EA077F
MPFSPVLHSEWIKIRSLRSLIGALCAIPLVTAGFTALFAATGTTGADTDVLYPAFFGVTFGQIAAIAFGTTAVSAEFHGGALRLSLAAVPHRRRWFAAKATAIGLPVLAVGLVTGAGSLAVGKAVMATDGPSWTSGSRGVLGCGIYLTLMALFAAGLTAALRSAAATLSVLIPLLLIVSFVIGDLSGGVADFLPDRAGQVVLRGHWDGSLGPWSGLVVTALWASAALLGGAWSVRRRDA